MNNQIYMIFYDRGNRAQDNGEHLCRWVMQNHPEIKTGYILSSVSSDWPRLKAEGFNLIDSRDKAKTHEELLKCDYACSSIFNEGINLNFDGCTCKRVFLNHGCFLVPIKYIKDEHDKVDLFIAANKIEYDTLLNPYHQLTSEQVALCGQPRQDDLVKLQKTPHTEDSILIQFWQRPPSLAANHNKKFLESTFYKKTVQLLKNEKLLHVCRIKKLKIVFKMHSIQYNWLQYFKECENDVVRISPLWEPFEPEFIRSKFIVTDISSNAYEMAKINKPCVYFEPDPDFLFEWRYRRNGGFEFDLAANSIGPIIYEDVEKAVNVICNLIKNDYKLDEKYIERRAEQISFLNDTHNCERCFQAILKLERNQTSKTIEQNKKKLIEKTNRIKKKLELTDSGLPNVEDSLFW